MSVLVIYESLYGNTRDVGLAIAAGAGEVVDTEALEVGGAPTDVPAGVDLVILGGPTHAFGMSRPSSRNDAPKYGEGPYVSPDFGIREWLKRHAADREMLWATFDTKVESPRLPGSASDSAARKLRRSRRNTVLSSESFWVTGTIGPLAEGELDRAREWGRKMATEAVGPDDER